jgi:hypothetical protein
MRATELAAKIKLTAAEGMLDDGVRKVGYIRVSRQDQNPDLQHGELDSAGCEKTFEERQVDT